MVELKIGDRVAFSREFLRNTGQYTGWAPFARGEVIAHVELSKGHVLARILWDSCQITNVLPANLVREDRIPLEPA